LAIAECTPILLLDWIASHPSWKSAHTKKNVITCVATVFNWAEKMRLIAENPFKGARIEEEGAQRRSMTHQELRRLCIHTDRRFRRWLRFQWHTGCWPGEAISLKWPMIDLAKGQAVLLKHKTARKPGLQREIEIRPRRMLQLLRAMYARDLRDGRGEDYVFRNKDERPWTRVYTSTKMQRLRRRAGVASDCVPSGARNAWSSQGVRVTDTRIRSERRDPFGR
jgi:integrase